jgi:hypothetical protein
MSYRVSSSQNQAARLLEGWRCTPAEVANDAIAWFDTLSQADADSAIDRPIDRIRNQGPRGEHAVMGDVDRAAYASRPRRRGDRMRTRREFIAKVYALA